MINNYPFKSIPKWQWKNTLKLHISMISRFVCTKMRCSSTKYFQKKQRKTEKKEKRKQFFRWSTGGVKVFAILFDTKNIKNNLSKNIAKPEGPDLDTNIRRHLSLLDFLF
jgi:hypothetical protein